jgi:sodium/proline symporter
MQSATTWVFVIYLVLLLALALWSRGATHDLKGYFIADKKLPPWVVAFSTNATGESGWLLLGLTGMGYAVGAHAFWVVAGEVIGITLSWSLLARRLKRFADEADCITVPDVLAARFDDEGNWLRGISACIILVMVGAYVAAQMVASGKAFSAFAGMDYASAVILGAVVIIGYTLIGGYKAVAWTDLVQGVLMWLGLIVLPIWGVYAAGGWDTMLHAIRAQDAALLSPWGPRGPGTVALVSIASFLAVGIPFLGVPQLMVRFMSARSEDSLPTAMAISIFVILCFDIGAVVTGMAGRALFPALTDAETILPVMVNALFPPVLVGVMMVVVLAAIMSTVDSLLILASSAAVRDVLQKICGVGKDENALAGYGKGLTLLIGLVGVAFALAQSPLIFWFVLFAWSGLGAAFGPVLLCALWYPPTNWYGAISGMLSGFLTTMVWALVFKPLTHDLLEIIPGFLVGLVVTVVVSKMTAAGAKRGGGFEAG